jgi:Domain of unknown function (DUF5655)
MTRGDPPAGAGRPMWTCPGCGRTFANRNQSHFCAPVRSLEDHFAGTEPQVRAAFDRVRRAVEAFGPVTVLPERTRIAFQVRMSFAAFVPRRSWLDGHLVLAHRLTSPRFRDVQVFSARNVLHTFRLAGPDDVDDEFLGWLTEAYQVGEQRHLTDRPPRGTPPPPG